MGFGDIRLLLNTLPVIDPRGIHSSLTNVSPRPPILQEPGDRIVGCWRGAVSLPDQFIFNPLILLSLVKTDGKLLNH